MLTSTRTETPTEPRIKRSEVFASVPRTSIIMVIPAYNEARYIGSVVLKARQYVDVVIVVDDGSTDGTADIARMAGAVVIQHEGNKGKGQALNTGFARSQELFLPSAIVTIDGDWQHLPEEMSQVVQPVLNGEADIVIGSRYLDYKSSVPLQRILGHWGFTKLINTFSGTRVTDSQSGYRAFSLRAARAIRFNAPGFGVESEMQFLASDHNLKVVEVPITIRYLDKPKRSVLKHGVKVLNSVLRLIGQHRPLLFFSGMGTVAIIAGILIEVAVIQHYYSSQELAIGFAMFAIVLCMIGFVSLCTGIILHSIRAFMLDLTRISAHQ